jgi:hypothetical protein
MADLERKTQQAVIDWIAEVSTHSVSLGITARHAEEDDTDTKTLPAVWVKADRQQELAPSIGIFQLTVDVVLEANLDDTANATFEGYLTNLETILQWDALASELSGTASSFAVYGIESRGPCSKDIDGRIVRWTYQITLWAHETD